MSFALKVVHEPPVFDWYQGTVEVPGDDLVDLARTALGDEAPRLVAGRNGYSRGVEIRRGGCRSALVMLGGIHEHPNLLGTGPDATAVASLLRRRSSQGLNCFPHRVSRVDVAVDTDTGGFEHMCLGLRAHRGTSKARLIHDPDHASEGATFYVGSGSSEVMARLYEKGKQLPEAGRPDWVRYEVQLRPQKSRKAWAAGASEVDLLGVARWSRGFASEYLGLEGQAPPPRSRRVSDLEGALQTIGSQYGGRILELAEYHDGDLGAVGEELVLRAMNGGRLGDSEAR
jgi:hypothetical protein